MSDQRMPLNESTCPLNVENEKANLPKIQVTLDLPRIEHHSIQDEVKTAPEKLFAAVKDLGSPVGALASALLAVVVGYYGCAFNERQIAAKRAELLSEYLTEVNSENRDKRFIASIRLAGHGADALPVIDMALGIDREDLRQVAVDAVRLLLESGHDRGAVMAALLKSLNSSNAHRRQGVLESLFDAHKELSHAERTQVSWALQDRWRAAGKASSEEPNVAKAAARLAGELADRSSVFLLLNFAVHPNRAVAEQALNSLEVAVPRVLPEHKRMLAEGLGKICNQLPADFRAQADEVIKALTK